MFSESVSSFRSLSCWRSTNPPRAISKLLLRAKLATPAGLLDPSPAREVGGPAAPITAGPFALGNWPPMPAAECQS